MNSIFQDFRPSLVNSTIFEQVVEYAIRTICEIGIGTSNLALLGKAKK